MSDSISEISDKDLVMLAQKGDPAAETAIYRKYKSTVKQYNRIYKIAGMDEEDIAQEAMIGLFRAIRQYDPEKEASFHTFARLCITRQIFDAIRWSKRGKHKALNSSFSIDAPVMEGEDAITFSETLSYDKADNPESRLVTKDLVDDILNNEGGMFTFMEKRILDEIVQGNDNRYISEKLKINRKSIDNARQRIKKKIIKYLQL